MKTKEFIRQRNNKGALLNVDYQGLYEYKAKKKVLNTIQSQEEKINKLESSVEEIKQMLVKILEAGNNK